MSETMRERVREIVFNGMAPLLWEDAGIVADAAIRCVIEALAAEADDMESGMWEPETAEWLRAHLDAGRDGEAGRNEDVR